MIQTFLICSHNYKGTDHLISIANNELAKIVAWLKANKIVISNFNYKEFYDFSSKTKET